MKIYYDINDIPRRLLRPCVTIGNFDGVHLGHQALFREVVVRSRQHKGTSIAITFDPHPLKVVRPETGIKLISTFEQKKEMISMAGLDILLVINFTHEFANTSAQDFVDTILMDRIGVEELVIGYDYAFGKGRQGDIDFLQAQGRLKGFDVSVVPPFSIDNMLVSSTKIRELVTQGCMEDVKKLMGRFYQLRGTVMVGKKRGGPVVGFPTANIHISEEDLCPLHGVYVTQVIYAGKCYGGVMNIGYNPTFGDGKLSAETHIFDFNDDIYAKPIKINLLHFLRQEKKFAGPQELSEQIRKDVYAGKKVLDEVQKKMLLTCSEEK